MANPRKFSEKIALHNKKQAEETAAFEAVLREVSATTQGAVGRQNCQSQQPQHLAHPTDAACRGGSLPNVKFASNNSIDLQNALHCLEGMKHESGRQSLIDKLQHRDRSRQIHEANQQRHIAEKRRDCSPYNLAYLSPPPDTSWRRANSDSAIHSSTLAAPVPQNLPSPVNSSPPPPTTNGKTVEMSPGCPSPAYMPFMGMRQSCSCDVPGISIHPSPEQDSGIHIPPISSNTGSLPDLSGLQFGAPGTPDDGSGTAVGSADPAYHHIGPMRSTGSQGSPSSRHRRARAGPKPLVLHSSAGQQQFQQQNIMQSSMMRYPGGSVSDCGTPSPSPLSPCLSQQSYSPPSPGFFSDAFYMLQQQNMLQQQFEQASLLHDSPSLDVSAQPGGFYHLLQPQSPAMFRFSPDFSQLHQQQSMSTAQPMPVHSSTNIIPSSYNYGSLPQSSSTCLYGSPVLHYDGCGGTVASGKTPAGQIRFNIGSSAAGSSPHGNRIPDIILTGADDLLGQQNHRDIDNAGRYIDDMLCFDDALGILDPLALDELQMLTDANVLTDQATEDSFRFD